jgi:hypothetical protein
MNREAILALTADLPREPLSQRLGDEASRNWLQQQIWNLPLQDPRSAAEFLGSGDDGLCL